MNTQNRPRSMRRFASRLAAAGALFSAACSSSVDPAGNSTAPPATFSNKNLNVGMFCGVDFTGVPITSRRAAGALIPGNHDTSDRSIVFVAFATEADAGVVDREGPVEGNATFDVFVAAVSDQDVNRNAFAQSLAGKVRHPRCITCHSIAALGNTPFMNNGGGSTHPIDLTAVDVTNAAECSACHDDVTPPNIDAKTAHWKAPAASFNMIGETISQLNNRAKNAPGGSQFHFFNDSRVGWALTNGHLPNSQVADDNRDGLAQCEDFDRVRRTVPGGQAEFLKQILAWQHGGFVADNSDAVKDVVLASQHLVGGVPMSGDGASFSPSLTYVPNDNFDPDQPAAHAAGTLFVAFTTEATNLVSGFTTNTRDIVRVSIEVWVDRNPVSGSFSPGDVNLRFVSTGNVLVSESATNPGFGGNDSSDGSSINADGTLVAYHSRANDVASPFIPFFATTENVFVRKIGAAGFSQLASHSTAGATNGADDNSDLPSLSADGTAVAFQSAADNLVAGDTNGAFDVFYVRIDSATGTPTGPLARASLTNGTGQGTGGNSGSPSIAVDGNGDVLVAFQSEKTNLVTPVPIAPVNVFLRRTATSETFLLSQIHDAGGVGVLGNGSSRAPVINDAGTAVVFETDADNLDELRPVDENHATDIVRADLTALLAGTGFARLHRLSVTSDGADAIAGSMPGTTPSSTGVSFGAFRGPKASAYGSGFAVFGTAADNLGAADTDGTMLVFARETVTADPPGVAPSVTFTGDVTSGFEPLIVTFTAVDANATATGWCWDFGDGSIPDQSFLQQNPVHSFLAAGTYTVSVTAHWAGGGVTTKNVNYITVNPPFVPPTWTQVYVFIANNGCTACHFPAGSAFPMQTKNTAFNNLVSIGANCTIGAATLRVAPSDSVNSMLIRRISGNTACGNQMGTLTGQQITDLAAWIDDGAPNN